MLKTRPGLAVHPCNLSTHEAKAEGTVRSRQAWDKGKPCLNEERRKENGCKNRVQTPALRVTGRMRVGGILFPMEVASSSRATSSSPQPGKVVRATVFMILRKR